MHRAWIAVLSLLCLWSPRALAQDRAAARALFEEGAKLASKRDYAAACPKFEASLAQDPKLGTKIALGACYENIGRTASAWAEFRDAIAMARKEGASAEQQRKYAFDHARVLEDKLNRLAIFVPTPAPGMVVKRDGNAIPEAMFGVPVPVDPGEHTVTASADGYQPWTEKVKIGAEATSKVTVPALDKVAAPPPVEPPPISERPPVVPPVGDGGRETPPLRWVGYGVGGAGVILVGVGLIVGAGASSKWSDAKEMCTGDSEPLQCTPEGVKLRNDAASAATLSTVTVVAGVAAVGAGVTLILLSPSRPRRMAVTPAVSPAGVSVVLSGGF